MSNVWLLARGSKPVPPPNPVVNGRMAQKVRSARLVNETMRSVSENAGGGKLSFGLVTSLWAAAVGFVAVSEALNAAYGLKERRSWIKVRLISLGLTVSAASFITASLLLLLVGAWLSAWLDAHTAIGDTLVWTWRIAQWPVMFAFMVFAFSMVYRFAPDVNDRETPAILPGAILAVVLWLAISIGLRMYLSYFPSYDKLDRAQRESNWLELIGPLREGSSHLRARQQPSKERG